MQYWLEHVGVSIAAITGVLAARGKQIDLFGVLVLALVTSFGGGTIRDVLLGSLPVFWVTDQTFVLNAVITAVMIFYLVRFHELPIEVLMVADAFALALFTMIGTRKGLAFPVAPSIAVMLGVTTGVAGGILRDLLIGQIPLVFRREIFLYATAAFGGALTFVLLQEYCAGQKTVALISFFVTLLLRLAGIKWQIPLPMFRPKLPPSNNPTDNGQ